MSDLTAMTADQLAEKVASVIATAAFHANEEGRQLDYSDLHQADGFLAELARRAAALPAVEKEAREADSDWLDAKAECLKAEARCAELEKERDEAEQIHEMRRVEGKRILDERNDAVTRLATLKAAQSQAWNLINEGRLLMWDSRLDAGDKKFVDAQVALLGDEESIRRWNEARDAAAALQEETPE